MRDFDNLSRFPKDGKKYMRELREVGRASSFIPFSKVEERQRGNFPS